MYSRSFFKTRSVFVASCVMLCAASSQAGTLSFHVDLNTAALTGNSNGPFSLDFQLNQGSGAATNTVDLTDFVFTGGTPSGSPSLFGGATGDLGSSVSLTDAANASNEFFQGFTDGTTEIDFDASLTTDVDAVTPDAFVMAILDNTTANIPTTGLGDSMLLVNISASNLTLGDVETATSTSPDAGAFVLVSPEPGTSGLAFGAVLLMAGWSSRRLTGRTAKDSNR